MEEETEIYNPDAEYLIDLLSGTSNELPPLASLDFAPFLEVEAPRDGVQRPELIDLSVPTSRNRPARARDRQPSHVHVTHVHQTLLQAPLNLPIATARPALAYEGGSGVAGLERSLSLPASSISKPASRWKHRSKAAVAAGMPACTPLPPCMRVPSPTAPCYPPLGA